MTKVFIILPLIMLTQFSKSFGQLVLSKKNIKQSFRESSRQDNELTSYWLACDNDSAFYKSDIVVLYNNTNYTLHSNCCSYVKWNFLNSSAFYLTYLDECVKPPAEAIRIIREQLAIKIKKKGEKVLLVTTGEFAGDSHLDATFEIVAFDYIELWKGGDKTYRLTVKRIPR
jgi:hypothetical protein